MALPARRNAMSMTAEEFLLYPLPDGKAELVRGELRVIPPAGGPHGTAATNLLFMLGTHARQQRSWSRIRPTASGMSSCVFRAPFVCRTLSFVRADRLPEGGIGPGLLKLAPDLAVEVLSPSETASELEEKLDDYTIAGTPLVWVVDPVRRTVMIVAINAPVRWLREGDTLDGGDVIAGFACEVSDIFEGIAR